MNDMLSPPEFRSSTKVLGKGPAALNEAAAILRAGGLVAMPTETVYGLAADASDPVAVAGIYAAKGRPVFNPLISHCADLASALLEGVFNADALALATHFWPGPLTLVVPVAPGGATCELARAGLGSVALRVPSHPVARELIALAGRPLSAPSANRSGHVSPTSAGHVLADLDGRIDAVVDAGPSLLGIESTIISCLGDTPVLLRPGGVARVEAEAVVGKRLGNRGASELDENSPIAPGMLGSHYAPQARMRLDAERPMPHEAWLALGQDRWAGHVPSLNLSQGANLTEAAARLYGCLRELDALGPSVIAVAAIPFTGLGEAINDRLARAAAPLRG